MNDIHTCSYDCTRPACIKAQRDELRERLAGLEADARRYRWLRSAEAGAVERPYIGYRNGHGFSHFTGDFADAAIDSAMQESRDG